MVTSFCRYSFAVGLFTSSCLNCNFGRTSRTYVSRLELSVVTARTYLINRLALHYPSNICRICHRKAREYQYQNPQHQGSHFSFLVARLRSHNSDLSELSAKHIWRAHQLFFPCRRTRNLIFCIHECRERKCAYARAGGGLFPLPPLPQHRFEENN